MFTNHNYLLETNINVKRKKFTAALNKSRKCFKPSGIIFKNTILNVNQKKKKKKKKKKRNCNSKNFTFTILSFFLQSVSK